MLHVVKEEIEHPLLYDLSELCSIVRAPCIPMNMLRFGNLFKFFSF